MFNKLRPTSGKVRQAIFNIMKSSLCGSRVLELYAGTGSFSLESIKRGASFCVLVEKDGPTARRIREKLEKNGIPSKVRIIHSEVLKALKKMEGEKFNIVFADPPYKSEDYLKVFEAIDKYGLVEVGGTFIVEHYHKKELPEKVGKLVLIDSRKYGQTRVSFFSDSKFSGGRE